MFNVSKKLIYQTIRRRHSIKIFLADKPNLLSEEDIQYIYTNGTANLTCEAVAEPPANFSWYRHGKKINPRQQTIHMARDISQLEITLTDPSVLGQYRCRAANLLGAVDHEILLKEGVKPEPPSMFVLRGVNYEILDVDVGATKPKKASEMDTLGYRFEIMPVQMFEEHDQDWTLARQIDFPVEDKVTYILKDLKPGTRYIVRVASRNVAGLSDFTDPKEFSTHSHGVSNEASTNLLATSLILLINIAFNPFQ